MIETFCIFRISHMENKTIFWARRLTAVVIKRINAFWNGFRPLLRTEIHLQMDLVIFFCHFGSNKYLNFTMDQIHN